MKIMDVGICAPAVWNRAVDLFGSKEKALCWIRTRLSELDNRTPEEILSENPSSQAVDVILDRIEYGVFG